MKTLILIRHAKSSWDDADLADFDRPLNGRGKKDVPRMGKRLRERSVHPDYMLSSPANRALTTCQEIARELDFHASKIKTSKNLYHATDDGILEAVRALPDFDDREEVVLLFGHNPGLTDFANRLLNEKIVNIPTCGVVACRLSAARWKDVQWGGGELLYFDFPKKDKD